MTRVFFAFCGIAWAGCATVLLIRGEWVSALYFYVLAASTPLLYRIASGKP